jgi:hypothetical protein
MTNLNDFQNDRVDTHLAIYIAPPKYSSGFVPTLRLALRYAMVIMDPGQWAWVGQNGGIIYITFDGD